MLITSFPLSLPPLSIQTQGLLNRELPWWLRQYRNCLQCRRPRFSPWIGKIPWRRKWQPTPVFLSEKSHGQRSLVCYSPWGQKESDLTECLSTVMFNIVLDVRGEHDEHQLRRTLRAWSRHMDSSFCSGAPVHSTLRHTVLLTKWGEKREKWVEGMFS